MRYPPTLQTWSVLKPSIAPQCSVSEAGAVSRGHMYAEVICSAIIHKLWLSWFQLYSKQGWLRGVLKDQRRRSVQRRSYARFETSPALSEQMLISAHPDLFERVKIKLPMYFIWKKSVNHRKKKTCSPLNQKQPNRITEATDRSTC